MDETHPKDTCFQLPIGFLPITCSYRREIIRLPKLSHVWFRLLSKITLFNAHLYESDVVLSKVWLRHKMCATVISCWLLCYWIYTAEETSFPPRNKYIIFTDQLSFMTHLPDDELLAQSLRRRRRHNLGENMNATSDSVSDDRMAACGAVMCEYGRRPTWAATETKWLIHIIYVNRFPLRKIAIHAIGITSKENRFRWQHS